jgi:hypothetical protein
VFYCCHCAELEQMEKMGLEKYKISDTLIYINAPITNLAVLKEIDQYKFGKNNKLKIGEQG